MRTLSIVSMNLDSMTTKTSRLSITESLLRNKIHIAAIQETHIPYNQNYMINGYRLINSAAQKDHNQTNPRMPTGGVAILIHESIEHHITHIQQINSRIIVITLHSKCSHPTDNNKHIRTTQRKKEKRTKTTLGGSEANNKLHTEKTHKNMVCRYKW